MKARFNQELNKYIENIRVSNNDTLIFYGKEIIYGKNILRDGRKILGNAKKI